MNRRQICMGAAFAIAAAPLAAQISGEGKNCHEEGLNLVCGPDAIRTLPHVHKFEKSPFYLMAAVSYEEPGYYPPSGMFPVQICSCGEIRLAAKAAAEMVGRENL